MTDAPALYKLTYYTKQEKPVVTPAPWYKPWQRPTVTTQTVWVRHAIGGFTQAEVDRFMGERDLLPLLVKMLPFGGVWGFQYESQSDFSPYYLSSCEVGGAAEREVGA